MAYTQTMTTQERNARRMAIARISLNVGTPDDFALVLGDDAIADDKDAIALLRSA